MNVQKLIGGNLRCIKKTKTNRGVHDGRHNYWEVLYDYRGVNLLNRTGVKDREGTGQECRNVPGSRSLLRVRNTTTRKGERTYGSGRRDGYEVLSTV